jgi:peptidyl-prolyl cis-trans isomerase B (cyclophilin B)
MIYQLRTPEKGDTVAVMKTSMGDISIRLFPDDAPRTVENFVTHARNGYYNNLKFHRIINDFMIQGGDPKGNGTGGQSIWGTPFKDEFSPRLYNFRGALSMANSGANTNGSQFFIVQKKSVNSREIQYIKTLKYLDEVVEAYENNGGTMWLDNKHSVFGQVFEGFDILDKLAEVETDASDKPAKDILVLEIVIKEWE